MQKTTLPPGLLPRYRGPGDWFGEFWPTRGPRRFDISALSRRSQLPPTSAAAPSDGDDIASHWLAACAARVEYDEARIAAL